MIPKVAMLPASDDGCAFYRLWLPHLRTANSKWVQADEKGLVHYAQFADCNVGVVQRLMSDKNFETLQAMKELGMKIIYDLDDDMWSVQSSNPAKSHLKLIQDYARGFESCAMTCDVITVSTARLKSSVEQHTGTKVPVKVIGNAVDLSLLRQSPVKRTDSKIVIGWAGSNTHINDLAQMGSALEATVFNNREVALHFIGMLPPGNSLRFHERVMAHGWVPVKMYPVNLATWNWDIGVAPLENNRFNRSKSAIKMMELGALKKPCLCSPVQPYLEFVSFSKELEWLLCYTEKEWATKLDTLVKDKDKRDYYGNLMYDVVKENYNMEKRAVVWNQLFSQLLSN